MSPYYDRDGITIFCGDTNLILGELPAESVDALITDPPYSSGGALRSDRAQSTRSKYVQTDNHKHTRIPEFSGDHRDQRSYEFWSVYWMSQAFRVAREGAVCAVFTDWRQLMVTADALQAAGWVWRGIVVWDKTGSVRPMVGRFSSQCEYVIWGSKGAWVDNAGAGAIPGVVQHPPLYEGRDEKFHIAAKPIPVMKHLLRIVRPGGVVLDPFGGSGGTPVAAKEMGLQAVVIEQDEHYCDVMTRRLAQSVLPLDAA